MPNNIAVEMTIYTKLQKARLELSKTKLSKSGYNKHLGFNYFELADFVPTAIELFAKYDLCPLFSIGYDSNGIMVATLTIVSGTEQVRFTCPVELPANMSGTQAYGAVVTYYRRYLYQMRLDLVENDIIDPSLEKNEGTAEVKKATAKQVEMIAKLYDEENLNRILEFYKVEKLEDLTMKDASIVIKRKNG